MKALPILVAPNAFKNSLPAPEAAKAIQEGLQASKLTSEIIKLPIADGGDGMLDVLVSQFNGKLKHYQVTGPLGTRVNAKMGWINADKTAVIELAEASGLRLINQEDLEPMLATTYGTGELIVQALDEGAEEIIIGVGGSASVDGGAGIIQALGGRLLDHSNREISGGGGQLGHIRIIDRAGVDQRIQPGTIKVACDVKTALKDAASVFGPQKGASPIQVDELEQNLRHFAKLIEDNLDKAVWEMEKCGAAGGASAGLFAFLDAQLLNGPEFLLERSGFREALQDVEWVITAEGGLDPQTLSGKGPFYVADEARKAHKKVIMLAGNVAHEFWEQGKNHFDAVFSISQGPQPLQEALRDTRKNLFRTAQQIGNLLFYSRG